MTFQRVTLLPMARKPRFSPGGIAYHVMNRTWPGQDLFDGDADYAAFLRVLAEAVKRHPAIRCCAFCLMPNHFHLVLFPRTDGLLSRFMQWLQMTHTQRWHAHRRSAGRGHLYQSRFRSFPIQTDAHFLTVCRYVERNALRADLVRKHAHKWPWSSAHLRENPPPADAPLHNVLANWPVQRPADYDDWLDAPQTQKELAALRTSAVRGRPFGDEQWAARTARKLGIESSLRPIGRPKKKRAKSIAMRGT